MDDFNFLDFTCDLTLDRVKKKARAITLPHREFLTYRFFTNPHSSVFLHILCSVGYVFCYNKHYSK